MTMQNLTPAAPPAGNLVENLRYLRGGAAAQARGTRLLARTVVAVDRAGLDGLVDRLDEQPVLALGGGVVAGRDGALEPAEVGLDPRGVAAVLEPLARGAL